MACSDLKYDFTKVPGEFNVLVCCSGSVAALKIPILVSKIRESFAGSGEQVNVRVVTTEHAKHFFEPRELEVVMYEDADEWNSWKTRADPVLHIELRKWAHLMVISPLCANTMAKLANGLCDNLLTCVARAWDFSKPIGFAAAMNTCMWEHPLTGRQVACLRELGYVEIPCVVKTLVCGDTGLGAMAHVDTILDFIKQEQAKAAQQSG